VDEFAVTNASQTSLPQARVDEVLSPSAGLNLSCPCGRLRCSLESYDAPLASLNAGCHVGGASLPFYGGCEVGTMAALDLPSCDTAGVGPDQACVLSSPVTHVQP
jgi:hypothetical protein